MYAGPISIASVTSSGVTPRRSASSATVGSRGGRCFAANTFSLARSGSQVLDHPEPDVTGTRLDLWSEVVHEAADHLVSEPLELGIDFDDRPRRECHRVTFH